jgi:hypothetical protein
MKRIVSFAIVITLAAIIMAPAFALAETGNGAPNGAHFNLNVIGTREKNGDMTGGGNVIFVKLWGADTKINLVPGEDFAVLDKDGTDGSATLQLMDPYPGTTTEAAYRIYVRALGKPGGYMGMTTGFTDEFGVDWYSLESVNLTRTKGQSKFTDKTIELTTIYIDLTDDGIDNPVRMNIFDNALYDYFWNYDNSGLKLLQMRFYVS